MLPLLGGSGGGGGSGYGAGSNCTGGGGGGGAGGILVVANGTLTLTNYDIQAIGGNGGGPRTPAAATAAAAVPGGAIRLVASRFASSGNGRLYVYGGGGGYVSGSGTPDAFDWRASMPARRPRSPRIRLRFASRARARSPIRSPQRCASPRWADSCRRPRRRAAYGAIDVVLPAPGVAGVDVATSGVPSGTTVLVTVKPRIGGPAQSATVPLTACNSAGECTATTAFTLAAGAYFVEARATFQVQ